MARVDKDRKKHSSKNNKKDSPVRVDDLNNYLSKFTTFEDKSTLLKEALSYLLKSTDSRAGMVFIFEERKNTFKSLGILCGKKWVKCQCSISPRFSKSGKKRTFLKTGDLRKNLIKSGCADVNLIAKQKHSLTYPLEGVSGKPAAIIEILRDGTPYGKNEKKQIQVLISHCERALKTIEKNTSYENYSAKLKTLSDVIHIINDSRNINDLAGKLEKVMHKAIPYDSLVFATYDDTESYIVDLYISYQNGMIKRNNLYAPTTIGEMKETLKREKTLRVDDITKDSFALARAATIGEGMSSEMIVGCISKNRIIGVFVLVKKDKNFYTNEDEWFMKMIAKDVTSAMVRFRADGIFKKQNLFSRLCNSVTQKTLKSADTDEAVKNLFAEIGNKLQFDSFKVGIFNEDFSKLTICLQAGNNEKMIGPNDYFDKERIDKVIKILSSKKRYFNIKSHPGKSFFDETIPKEKKLLSALIFPLILPSRIIGFISILSKNINHFDKVDMEGFATVAESFSVALDNLTLKNKSLGEKKNWETTFDSISDYILIINRKGNITRLNRTARKILKKIETNKNKTADINSFLAYLDIPYAESFRQLTFDENQPVRTVIQSVSGSRFFNLLIDPVKKERGKKCEEAVFQIKDITDIKNTELELKDTGNRFRKEGKKFKTLSRIASIITGKNLPNRIFEKIGDEINTIISFDSGKVWVFDKDTEELEAIYKLSFRSEKFSSVNAMKTGLKNSFIMDIIRNEKPLIRNITGNKGKYREDKFISEAKIRSVLYIPLISKGKIAGCVSLGTRNKNAFGEDDISFMNNVQSYISSYLENLKLLSELSQANAEWESTFNSTNDYIFITDSENKIIKCNTSFRKDYLDGRKYSRATKCYEIFCQKEDGKKGRCLHKDILKDKSLSVFELTDNITGRTFVVSISSISVFPEKEECFVHIATDVTDVRKAEEMISKQATQLDAMFENSPDGMILFDANENIVKMSPSAENLIKFNYGNSIIKKRADFVKNTKVRMLYPDGNPIPSESFPVAQAFKKGNAVTNFELIVENNNGRRMNFLENVIPLKDNDGNIEGAVSIFKDITEAKAYEEKLRKQSTELNTVFENMPDGMIFMDREQKITRFSPSASKILGFDLRQKDWNRRKNFLKNALSKITRNDGTQISLEDLPISKVYKTGIPAKNEEIIFHYKDGRKQHLLIHILPLKGENNELDGVVSIFKDITSLKEVEEQLRKQADELNNMFVSFQDALILIDSKGKILKLNTAAKKLFEINIKTQRFNKESFLNRYHFFNHAGESIPFEKLPLARTVKEGVAIKNYEAAILIDGRIKKMLLMNSIPFKNENGDIYSALGVYSDMTDKKMLESKLLQSEKLSSLGTMVAGIAHELNNPLSGIVGFSELLLGENLEKKQMEKIKIINAQADRASSIIKDLMIFSKQKGEYKKPVNINELLNQAEKMVAYGFKNHNINLEKSFLESIPIIYANTNRLLQAFINILKNSYQNMTEHNPTGTITISTCVEKGILSSKGDRNTGNAISIQFRDEGSGIDQTVIKKIFDPFYSLSEAKDSVGLGLSITYSIVREHGGEILITSEKREWTNTQIYLPIPESVEYPDEKKPPEIIRQDGLIMPKAGLIIVVSKDKEFFKTLMHFKASHSIKPFYENTLKGALERIKNEYFHLILFDLDMKKINIKKFYKESLKTRKDISEHLMFTGSKTLNKEEAQFINIIGSSYIKKPLSREKIHFLFHSIANINSLK